MKFFFEWNQGYGFGCNLGFNDDEPFAYEFPLGFVISKLKANKLVIEPTFGREFSRQIHDWVQETNFQVSQYQVQNIKYDDKIIEELRAEFRNRDKEYNREKQLEQIKRSADKAWNEKDFKSLITILNDKLEGLPSSYKKKLELARKKIRNDD